MTEEIDFSARLSDAGMQSGAAAEKAAMLAKAVRGVMEWAGGGVKKVHAWFVPGRIEVLGKHTDYAGGRSLLATVERGFCVAAVPRSDAQIRIRDLNGPSEATFALSPDLQPAAGHWSGYAITVARRVARNFPEPLVGADIVFASDLPPAAGMSSSSALLIAIFKVLACVNALEQRPEYRAAIADALALAGYLATIENGQSFGPLTGDRGVGTFGGSEDHTAILCCLPGVLSLYSFCPARLEQRIAMPGEYTFVIASSGVLAEKTGPAMARYNRVSQLVSAILQCWREQTGRTDRSLADAGRSASDAPERLRGLLARVTTGNFAAADLVARFDQFMQESQRIIPAAAGALASGSLADFGRQVDESQRLAEQQLGNQIPQTRDLARFARAEGAVAASAFGAGFGGSVWALTKKSDADRLIGTWRQRYQAAYPADAEKSTFFSTGAGPALVEF